MKERYPTLQLFERETALFEPEAASSIRKQRSAPI